MKKSLLFLFALLTPALMLLSQTPASSTFQVNKIKARLNADGAMFADGATGQFIPIEPGLAELTLLHASGIWLAGVDPGGNLKGAVYTTGSSDYEPGVLDENGAAAEDLNKIWGVNCTEINAFRVDLNDNGILDNPNPSVLGWPAEGNPYFEQYNSPLTLPISNSIFAGFLDQDEDGLYDPSKGDYPSLQIRGCPLNHVPNDQAWFVFRDRGLPHPSNLNAVGTEIQAQVFGYKTLGPSPFDNTLFVRYKFINRASARIDSCYFGLYTNFSVGNPNDDYAGLDLDRSLIYAYNGDVNDEGGFGAEAPVVGVQFLRGPLDTLGYPISLSRFVVLNNTNGFGPLEYYRVLSGAFPDGTPAPNNGLMYPGNPNDPNGQSEAALGNTPGHRIGVASFGPFTLQPGAVNELIVAYSYAWQSGKTAVENVQTLLAGSAPIKQQFNDCFAGFDNECYGIVDAPERPVMEGLLLYPNPAAETCTLESKNGPLRRIVIMDMLGRLIHDVELDGETLRYDFSTSALPAGIYSVRVAGGEMKLAVQR